MEHVLRALYSFTRHPERFSRSSNAFFNYSRRGLACLSEKELPNVASFLQEWVYARNNNEKKITSDFPVSLCFANFQQIKYCQQLNILIIKI